MSDELVEQLGFYFSDANLRKDKFLRSHTGKAGTGQVRVSLLAAFRRVRALTTDEEVVRAALARAQGLQLSADGSHVCRVHALPVDDHTDQRTVYVEPLPLSASIASVGALFGECGRVVFVQLPRLPAGATRAHALVEFGSSSGAERAVAELDGVTPEAGSHALRVLPKLQWLAERDEYRRLHKEGMPEEQARCRAEATAAAAREEERQLAASTPRTVVAVTNIGRGGNIKVLRRELAAVCEELAPVDYVDYGISNSGNPTVAFIRFKTEVGAAEAARLLQERRQEFAGKVVEFDLMSGAPLREYLHKIGQLRRASAVSKKKKRDQWWARKYGGDKGGTSGGGSSEANNSGGDGDAEPNEEGGVEGTGCAPDASGVDAAADCGVSGASKRTLDDGSMTAEAGTNLETPAGVGGSKRSRIA